MIKTKTWSQAAVSKAIAPSPSFCWFSRTFPIIFSTLRFILSRIAYLRYNELVYSLISSDILDYLSWICTSLPLCLWWWIYFLTIRWSYPCCISVSDCRSLALYSRCSLFFDLESTIYSLFSLISQRQMIYAIRFLLFFRGKPLHTFSFRIHELLSSNSRRAVFTRVHINLGNYSRSKQPLIINSNCNL